jgi:hypothetical protein
MKRSFITLLVFLSLFGTSLGVSSSKADSCSNSITVMNTNDSGVGSLRQAIADICPGGTIVFDASLSGQTITLDSILVVNKELAVDGSALVSKISVDGNENVPVFEISYATAVTLDSLIITNGNTTDPAFAGGILNNGSLHIRKSVVTRNAGVEGGGIRNMGTLDLIESVISENSADDLGGGILNYGDLNVTRSIFSHNQAVTGGGVYHDFGIVTVDDSLFSENSALGSGTGGGGISMNAGMLYVSSSTFSGNSAESGGGIYVRLGGLLDIRHSFFTNNAADTGGGVSSYAGLTTVVNSTFSGNHAHRGGGIYSGRSLNVGNSTFFNNSATSYGGGIHNDPDLTLFVTNSTFSNNSASFGGGISNLGHLRYANTILANSTSGDDCYSPSLAGASVDLNIHNIVEDHAVSSDPCGIPLISADPRLGPLKDNDGTTQTMALLPGSPALGVGDPGNCAIDHLGDNRDQRSVIRPQGDPNCDIGSYESSLLIDLTPPDAPLVTAPPAYTNDTTPVIGGAAEPDSQVNIWYLDDQGSPLQICQNVLVDDSGAWSCVSSITLPERNIELIAHATDEADNQSADTSHVFVVDLVLPKVVSILRAQGNPIVENTVDFSVIFSEPVTNLSARDFTLVASQHILGAAVDEVSGSGDHYTVTVRTGSGNGSLRLDVPVDAAATDLAGNSLETLPFVTGETYVIRKSASVAVSIDGDIKGSYVVIPGTGTRYSYNTTNNGPVKIESTNSISLMAAERVIYRANGINTSYTEMMGLPGDQLDSTYWLPWYNNVDLDTQLRFANVDDTTATVHVFIGEAEMSGSPFTLFSGESTRRSFAGINAGPVKIVSDVRIVAAERIIYRVKGIPASFSEMMALPEIQLDSTYWLPWYNNRDLDTQLRIANVADSPGSVRIYIGGQEMQGSPFTLLPGESTRMSFAGINDGPVKIVSSVPIVAAERIIFKVKGIATSFSEMTALPDSQLDTTYWLPWYNNVDLDTQLRFANVHDSQTATVHVYIGGQDMQGSPFTLLAGQSARQSFTGVNNGPVQVVSDVAIVAAQRVIYKVNNLATSFSEMMGLPDSQLDAVFWLPWYNNVDLDTQLRFGVP